MMRLLGAGLFSLLFLAACSRQPLGVNAAPPAATPVSVARESAEPNPQTAEAIALRPEEGMDAERVMGDDPREVVPDEQEVKAMRQEQVRLRRERMQQPAIEENETAAIENQGSLGQAPLTPPAADTAPAAPVEAPTFTFQKSACYGDCEAYSFDLRSGGLTSLFVDKGKLARGLYNRQLYSVDYAQLNNDIDSLRQMDLAPVYPVDEDIPADIPFRSVTLLDGAGEPKTIKVYSGAPPALERFLDRLEAMIEEQSWERASDRYPKN